MKKLAIVLLLGLPIIASASNCDEISANIAEKIKNNGVNEDNFQLKLVPSDQDEQTIKGQIVGSCDRGKQSIVYIRAQYSSTKTTKDESKTSVESSISPSLQTQKSNNIPNVSDHPVQTQVSAPASDSTPAPAPVLSETEREKVQTSAPSTTENQEPKIEQKTE
jgi:Protein of unknown function (DUF1161).